MKELTSSLETVRLLLVIIILLRARKLGRRLLAKT